MPLGSSMCMHWKGEVSEREYFAFISTNPLDFTVCTLILQPERLCFSSLPCRSLLCNSALRQGLGTRPQCVLCSHHTLIPTETSKRIYLEISMKLKSNQNKSLLHLSINPDLEQSTSHHDVSSLILKHHHQSPSIINHMTMMWLTTQNNWWLFIDDNDEQRGYEG